MKALKKMKFKASPKQRRWLILGSALAIVVVAALWPMPEEKQPTRQAPPPGARAPAPGVTPGPAPANAGAPPPGEAGQPGLADQAGAAATTAAAAPVPDIFGPRTWEPPPPPPDLSPPPPPEAPPLPFRFIGRITEPGKKPAFLLARGDEVLTVKVGDVIDRVWRLEKFTDGKLKFRYRPLNLLSILPIGDGGEP